MPKVFICYRREDSQYQADRLHLALRRVIPRRDIFIDIDNIPAGVDFVAHLQQRVSQCDVLLALIGRDWLDASVEGNPRLQDPMDFVRIEIAAALRREVPVVPVLLDGVAMPREDELPDDLKPLIRRNGIEIRRSSFDSDAKRLIEKLELNAAGGALHWSFAAVILVVVAVGIGGWFLTTRGGGTAADPQGPSTPPPSSTASPPVPQPDTSASIPSVEASQSGVAKYGPVPTAPGRKPTESAAVRRPVSAEPACAGCPVAIRQKLKNGASIYVSHRVTQAQWASFCADYHCPIIDDGTDPQLPVKAVSATEVDHYIQWLWRRSGRKYRLPTADELAGLLAESPGPRDSGVTEWTGTCHTGRPPQCDLEVRGWDARGKPVFDWYSPESKGQTLGFRLVMDN